MSNDAPPERIAVIWSPEARADLRAIHRDTAIQILYCVDRFFANRQGDTKKLKPPFTGLRLRCGDHRLFFEFKDPATIEITGVRHRSQAYR